MTDHVSIYEMGPRDGLQNEKLFLSVEDKIEFVSRLSETGLNHIEVGSFVSTKWVPQMEGSAEVVKEILARQSVTQGLSSVRYLALVPNEKGLQTALDLKLKEVAVFGAASESFSRANINCSIEESLNRFAAIVQTAHASKVHVRGYISTAFGCPFEGPVSVDKVADLAEKYLDMGIYQVSIGDTIGVASPLQVRNLLSAIKQRGLTTDRIAMHFHDTRGTGMANVLASLDFGIRTFDSSLGGLGGCPYAPAATGNIATEDLIYMCEQMGLSTAANFDRVLEVHRWMSQLMNRELPSRAGRAGRLVIKPFEGKS